MSKKSVSKTEKENSQIATQSEDNDSVSSIASLHLPDIKRHRVAFRISGEKLLVSRFEEKAVIEMLSKHMGIPTERMKKDPNADFENRKVINVKGDDVIPCIGIKAALIQTSTFTGKGKDKVPKTVLRGSLYVVGEGAPIKYGSVENNLGIVRNSNGNPDIRFRPLYRDWSCEFVVDFMPRMITADQLVYLTRAAGQSVGLCEWRPEKNGNHGLFDIELLNDKEIPRIVKACSPPLKQLKLPKWLNDLLESEGESAEDLIAEVKAKAKDERNKSVQPARLMAARMSRK